MADKCTECGGRLDKVGLYGCDKGHPLPNVAQRIVRAIERDLNHRKGLHLDELDEEIAYEMKDSWESEISKILEEAAKVQEFIKGL